MKVVTVAFNDETPLNYKRAGRIGLADHLRDLDIRIAKIKLKAKSTR